MKKLLSKVLLSSLIVLSACSNGSLFISEESIKISSSNKTENNYIQTMDIDGEGNIYFVDTANSLLIKKLTPDGKIQDFKSFDNEFSFSIDNDDNFYIEVV